MEQCRFSVRDRTGRRQRAFVRLLGICGVAFGKSSCKVFFALNCLLHTIRPFALDSLNHQATFSRERRDTGQVQ